MARLKPGQFQALSPSSQAVSKRFSFGTKRQLMFKQVSMMVFILLMVACTTTSSRNPHIKIQTKYGEIELELYQDKAPKTVTAFLSYVDSGLYHNSYFYRVMTDQNQPSDAFKANLIQGGIWRNARKKALSLPGIPHESTEKTDIHHTDGTISLARLEPGTATSEFFICVGDQPGFDYGGNNNPDKQGYAAFGRVTRGMDVVTKIYNLPEYDQAFSPPVNIFDIVRKP